MDSSHHSLARRLSFESTTTSEFEIVPRERSSSGSTVGGSYCKELSESSSPSPQAASFNVPDLFIANSSSDHSPPQCDDTAPKPASPNGEASIRPFTNTASQASGSDMSTMARESAGMLEQVFHELFTIKQRNSMLERMAQQSHEWRTATEQLEKETKILHKTVKACKNREENLEEEVKQLRQEKEELISQMNTPKEQPTKTQSTSWLHRTIVLGILVAVVAMYLNCYSQLLKEHRRCKDLEVQLSIVNELVEKLEVEHAAEYQRRLEETSKRITDDMSADIARARKERELEHERLIEAYREKMLLYDDLTTLRKEGLSHTHKKETRERNTPTAQPKMKKTFANRKQGARKKKSQKKRKSSSWYN